MRKFVNRLKYVSVDQFVYGFVFVTIVIPVTFLAVVLIWSATVSVLKYGITVSPSANAVATQIADMQHKIDALETQTAPRK